MANEEHFRDLYAWIWEAGIALGFEDVFIRVENEIVSSDLLSCFETGKAALLSASRHVQLFLQELCFDDYIIPMRHFMDAVIQMLRNPHIYSESSVMMRLFLFHETSSLLIYAKTREIEESPLSVNSGDADWARVKDYLHFEDDRYRNDLMKISKAIQQSRVSVTNLTPADHLFGYNDYRAELIDFSKQLLDALPIPHLQMLCKRIKDEDEYVAFNGASYFLEVFQNSEITREKLIKLIDLLSSDELVTSLSSPTLTSGTDCDKNAVKRRGVPSPLSEYVLEKSPACLKALPVNSVEVHSSASNIFVGAVDNVETFDSVDGMPFTCPSNVTVRKRKLCESPPCKNLKFKKYDIVQLNGQIWEIRNLRHNNEPVQESYGSCVQVISDVDVVEQDLRAGMLLPDGELPTAEQIDCDLYHLNRLTDKLRFLVSELEKKSKLLKEKKSKLLMERNMIDHHQASLDRGDGVDHDRDVKNQRMEICDLNNSQIVPKENYEELISSAQKIANTRLAVHSSTQNMCHDDDLNDDCASNSANTDFANGDPDGKILYRNDSLSRQRIRSIEKGQSTLALHETNIFTSERSPQSLSTPERIKCNVRESPPILSTTGKINSNSYDSPPPILSTPGKINSNSCDSSPPILSTPGKINSNSCDSSPPILNTPGKINSNSYDSPPPILSTPGKINSNSYDSPPTLSPQEKIGSLTNLSSPTLRSDEGSSTGYPTVLTTHGTFNSSNDPSIDEMSEAIVDKSLILASPKGETDVLKSESSINSCSQRTVIEYNSETLIISPSAQSVLQSKEVCLKLSPLKPAILEFHKVAVNPKTTVKSPKTTVKSPKRTVKSPKTKSTKSSKRKVKITEKNFDIAERIERKEQESSEDEFYTPETFRTPIN